MSSLTTNSSTSSSSLYATASSSKRLTGLMSGLDTDELVKQLTIGTQNKIDSANQKKQIATWQQEAYQTVIKSISEFQTKYFTSSSSSSSILNASFFNSTSIVNNYSTYVNVSGSSTVAQNMQIGSITSLAKQASYVATNKVSSQTIQTGKIQSEWTKSAVTSANLKITYEGKDYTLTVGSDGNTTTTADVLEDLNQQLKGQGLSGDLAAKLNDDGSFTISSASGKDVTVKSGSEALLSGLGLTAGSTATGSGKVNDGYFTNHSIASGSKLTLQIDGTDYIFTVSSAISLPVLSANPTEEEKTSYAQKLQTALNEMVKSSTDLKDKISFDVGDDGTVSLTSTEGKTVSITGGSQNLLKGLGLSDNTSIFDNVDADGNLALYTLYKTSLGDSLSGSTLTFDLNGLSKTISFNQSDIERFNNIVDSMDPPDETSTDEYKAQYEEYKNSLGGYLQEKLNSAYGSDKVKVSVTDGVLSFQTVDGTDGNTNVLTISSSSKTGILGADGALKIYAGESNRVNTSKTLRDLKGLSTELTAGTADDGSDVYKLSVNGKEFSFKATDSIDTIVKTINNDADANVTISYSSTLDRFSIAAKNGGASSDIDIQDTSGNLSKVLFGYSQINKNSNALDAEGNPIIIYETNEDGTFKLDGDGNKITVYETDENGNVKLDDDNNPIAKMKKIVQEGSDAKMSVSFDNGQSFMNITRSSNSFTMDGITFDLKKTTSDDISKTNPITFSVENKTDDLVTKIQTFIDDYNAILTTINGYITEKKPTDATYAPLTDDQRSEMSESQITAWEKKAKQGLLFNDSLLSSFAQDWRHSMTDVVSSMSSALYQVGISSSSYSDNGKLTVDEDKLKEVLNSDPDKIAQLFTSTDGIATRMQNVIKKYANDSLVNTGLFITKAGSSTSTVDTSELAKKMKEYDTQVKTLKTRLTSQQEYYYNKFTALETYIARMNSQASFFTQSSSS